MNQVFNEIQGDIDWRLLELKEYENIVNNLSSYEVENDQYDAQIKIILKSAIPMIYAHWEGFVTNSIKIIFQHLNELNLNNEYYCCTYLTTAYEKTLKSLDDSDGFEKQKKHLTNLYIEFGKNVIFDTKIDSKSNLNFKVLTEICRKTNLTINSFEEYKGNLNKLVNLRNSIAHGENAHVFEKFDAIGGYIDLLGSLMFTLKDEVQCLLTEEKYKKEIS